MVSGRTSSSRAVECGAQVIRQRCCGLDVLSRERVLEAEPLGVEELPPKAEIAPYAIRAVARHGQIDRGQVHPDLVRATRLEPDLE